MQQRGTHLAPLAQLDDLRALVARPGDVLSVCLPFRPANEDLAAEVRLEWRALREQAARAGAPYDALATVDRAVDGAHRAHAGLVVVVPRGGEPLVEGIERPPARSAVAWGPVPALVPLVADRQRRQPHVVALVDRQGADIVASTGRTETAGNATDHTVTTVQGATYPLRKVAPGGWSQRRFQQRAEETWQRNMSQVADEVAARADHVDARFVAVGGDHRAVGLLLEHLPVAVRDLVRPLQVTRATDGSAQRLDEEVDRVLDQWLEAETRRAVDSYREELGQRDRAVAGPADTLAALRAARVAQLLVVDGAAGANDATGSAGGPGGGLAWVGGTPEDVSLAREELLDPTEARQAPQHDVAVAAALATGADVRVVPDPALAEDTGGPTGPGGAEMPEAQPPVTGIVEVGHEPEGLPEGLGALLRW
jgi:hypothetical protein